MEEMAKEEEEEERKERIESALDVTKQKDMSGFYRHIYRYNQRSFRVLQTYLQVQSEEFPGSTGIFTGTIKGVSGFYRHIYRYIQRSFRVLQTYLQV